MTLREKLLADLDRLRAPEGYLRAGWPRYHTLFGRDSLIAAWQTLSVDPSIARRTLEVLADHQGRRVNPHSEEEPGKVLHEHRFDARSRAELPAWEFPYYGSVDSTPLFVIVADAYLRVTDDTRFARTIWPSVEAAIGWLRTAGDPDGDGLVEYARKNPTGLFHQGWKDGSEDHLRIAPPVALVEVQGYAYAAYRGAANIADALHIADVAREARTAADRLRGVVADSFWWPREGTFVLALDGRKRIRTAVTSNPGHLLFTGIVDEAKLRPLVDRLFRADLWTPYGIRTHATSEPDFDPYGYHMGTVWPHDNWIIYRGLLAEGFVDEAARIRGALLSAYERLGRIPELYAVVDDEPVDLSVDTSHGTRANPLQAWSTGALLDMLSTGGASP